MPGAHRGQKSIPELQLVVSCHVRTEPGFSLRTARALPTSATSSVPGVFSFAAMNARLLDPQTSGDSCVDLSTEAPRFPMHYCVQL